VLLCATFCQRLAAGCGRCCCVLCGRRCGRVSSGQAHGGPAADYEAAAWIITSHMVKHREVRSSSVPRSSSASFCDSLASRSASQEMEPHTQCTDVIQTSLVDLPQSVLVRKILSCLNNPVDLCSVACVSKLFCHNAHEVRGAGLTEPTLLHCPKPPVSVSSRTHCGKNSARPGWQVSKPFQEQEQASC
jgi:hypothetical protein